MSKRKGFQDAPPGGIEAFGDQAPACSLSEAGMRMLGGGAAGLGDQELIELLLARLVPTAEARKLAGLLLGRFGSFGGAISAPVSLMRKLPGFSDEVVAALRAVHIAAIRLAESEVRLAPLLDNWDRLLTYLNTVLAREMIEHFRVLHLDSRNYLLVDAVLGTGTVNHAPVYTREVMRQAIDLGTTALILVHNHPSGDPSPSVADIEVTAEISVAAGLLGIVLHDHIIVAREGYASMRRLGLIG